MKKKRKEERKKRENKREEKRKERRKEKRKEIYSNTFKRSSIVCASISNVTSSGCGAVKG